MRVDSIWAITPVPTVKVAMAIPPRGVSSPSASWTTNAPIVTAAAIARLPTTWPKASTRRTRRWMAASSSAV
jgi:hypothetical protein